MISHGASDLQTSHDFDQIAENCFECVSIDERFLSVSVDLVLRMTALWRLEILNLRMTKLLFKFVPFRGSFITENCSIYQRSTGDVMAAMLVVKNKNISFLWELNSIFMYTLWKKKMPLWPPTWPPCHVACKPRLNQILPMLLSSHPYHPLPLLPTHLSGERKQYDQNGGRYQCRGCSF